MKKFFKILMVFALLGGAALSCTKDYSKEIQDVQKQSQELKALIDNLQNSLNSTNATVAQLSKDLKGLTEEHKKDIETLTNRAKEIEGKIAELKGQVDINAKDIEDLQRIVGDINLTLVGLREDIDQNAKDIAKNAEDIATNKGLIDANLDQINKLWKQIEDLWAAIEKLSARLTNIVAAPAKVTEVQTIEVGDSARTIINMDFVVAPAEAAKAIAAKFGSDPSLKLTYTLYNALDRAHQTKAAPEYSATVEPYRVVEGKDKGVISVSAVVGKNVIDPNPEKSLYVTLTVAGEDEAGEFDRVSDPVKPIRGEKYNIFEKLQWYNGKVAVKEAEGTLVEIAQEAKAESEAADTVFVQGQKLFIVAPDLCWKEDLPATNNDLIAGYELKWKAADSQIFTLAEAAALLDIDPALLVAHFTANANKKAYAKTDYKPAEWGGLNFTNEATYSDVFTATGDTTSLKLGLTVALKGTDPEKAEFVGAYTKIASTPIALGKFGKTGCDVTYVQRICKHVTEQKAAEALHANFAFNAGFTGASQTDTTFSSVKWISTTSIARHGKAEIYVVKNGVLTNTKNGFAYVKEMTAQSKFVEVELNEVKFAAAPQTLQIVWKNEEYKNQGGVIAEVYTDYIDLTVDAFHAPVTVETALADTMYLKRSEIHAIKTKLAVKEIFGDDTTWFLNDEKAADPAQKGALEQWLISHVNAAHPYADSIVPPLAYDRDAAKEVYLTVSPDKKIVVNAPKNKLKHFVDGKDYKIYVTDSIDNVIKFHYVINFTSKKIGATIETIPGYVKNDSVYVNGSSIRQNGVWSYKIDDINLTQYYRLANLNERSAKDSLTAVFATPANVTFDSNKTSPAHYDWDIDHTKKYGVIDYDAKISWNGYNKNSFILAAAAALDGQADPDDSIYVTFWTKAPLYVAYNNGEGTLQVGKAGTFDLFEDFDVRGLADSLQNIIDNHTIYSDYSKDIVASNSASVPEYGLATNKDGFRAPTVHPYTEWSCTVDGVPYPYEQMMELFADFPAWAVVRDQHLGYSDFYAQYQLKFREHSAPATIVFTIPCTWEYAIGTLEFSMIFTLTVE